MTTVVVNRGQSIFDVAIQNTGTIEQVVEIAFLNGIHLNSGLPIGTTIHLPPTTSYDRKAVQFFKKNNSYPISGQDFNFSLVINQLFEATITDKINVVDDMFSFQWLLNDKIVGTTLVCPVISVNPGDNFSFKLKYGNTEYLTYFDTSYRFAIGEMTTDALSENINSIIGIDFVRFNQDILTVSSTLSGTYNINHNGYVRWVGDITYFNIGNTGFVIKDDTVKHFVNCTYLELLNTNAELTDESIKELNLLALLRLANTSSIVTDFSISKLINLTSLFLNNTNSVLTDDALMNLNSIQRLEITNIASCTITDVSIINKTSLRYLIANDTQINITDTSLATLSNLIYINLRNTLSVFTDAAIQNLTLLQTIIVNNTNTAFTNTAFQNLTALTFIQINGTSSHSIAFSPSHTVLKNIYIQDTEQTATDNDNVIINIDDAGATNGVLNIALTGGRTAASDTAKANLLARGWTITE